jgi:DNA-binding response OmpR family regulator
VSRDAGAPRQVLVADDEPHIGRILKTKLEQGGAFHVTVVYDGGAAARLLATDVPLDLVVLDLMMPERSGLEVLADLRRDSRRAELPVVVLTAAGQDDHRARALALGAADFVTKPFSPRRLYARIAELTGVAAGAAADGTP